MTTSHKRKLRLTRPQGRRSLRSRLVDDMDNFMTGPIGPDSDSYPGARVGRRFLWVDGFFSNISESFVLNFIVPFALALGANNGQVGALSALMNLASAAGLIPGARLEERSALRKRIVIFTSGLLGRGLLLALAAVPWFLGAPVVTYVAIALISLRALVNQLGYPAWSTLLADVVPKPIRGRYFGARNIGLAIAALVFTPLAGVAIGRIGGVRGYQVAFLIAGLMGFLGTASFAQIPDPPATKRAKNPEPFHPMVLLAAHPVFRKLTIIAFVWNLSLMIVGPFFSVFLVRDLGASPTQIGLLGAANAGVSMVGMRIFGRLNDRLGAVWVMRFTGLVIPAVPLLWALAPNPWVLIPVECLSGFIWAGYNLASFNLILGIAPEAQRARFVAIYQVSAFSAACIGPLIGSVIATFVGLRWLIVISAVGRLIIALIFMAVIPLTSDSEGA